MRYARTTARRQSAGAANALFEAGVQGTVSDAIAPGDERPVLFTLHNLGGSAREWQRVAERVAPRVRLVGIDLPGFGDAAPATDFSVAAMAAHVAAVVAAERPRRWLIAGHSMGGKVAAVVARAAEDGDPQLTGLAGIVLVAASPPRPEPMSDDQREEMLGYFHGDAAARQRDAERYVAENSGDGLDDVAAAIAVADALRLDRAAWAAWLERGSREDWAASVGVLQTPALVIAGGDDGALGPEAQAETMTPHYAHVRFETLPGAKHLLPLERADDVARLILALLTTIEYRALIASRRVSADTRAALSARERPDDPSYAPVAMDAVDLATLRALAACVVPQQPGEYIDLAARLDATLATGAGDGWRFAMLPPDAEAYRIGLRALRAAARRAHGCDFETLDAARQDALLHAIADRTLALPASVDDDALFGTEQMRAWFEEARADLVKIYMSHPRTLARIGYSGIANGGDGLPKSGFHRVGIGERETWEPVAAMETTR